MRTIVTGGVMAEVTLDIGHGLEIVSSITKGLRNDWAWFRASRGRH